MNNLLPTEEEIEMILDALSYFVPYHQQRVLNEEVIKAAQRVAKKAEASLNVEAFETAFAPKSDPMGFVNDLKSEIDAKATAKLVNKAAEEVTCLSAKIVNLREFLAGKTAERAIDELLK